MNAPKLLIIDDDPDLKPVFESYLGPFIQLVFLDNLEPTKMKRLIKSSEFDLILLDLNLGKLNGLEILEEIKFEDEGQLKNIILITGEGTIDDEIKSHGLGVLDFVKKPLNRSLLKAIVEKNLAFLSNSPSSKYKIGPFNVDSDQLSVSIEDENQERKLELTLKEFKIFNLLLTNHQKIFSQQEIFDRVWKEESDSLLKTVDIHIGSLRKKLGRYGECIQNKRGVGYFIEF